MELQTIGLFLMSSILLTLAPGPDILFTITQGISQGKKAGVLTALGLASGNIIHISLATLGVSVLFKTNATLFLIFKSAGAFYLFIWRTWLLNIATNFPEKAKRLLPNLILAHIVKDLS